MKTKMHLLKHISYDVSRERLECYYCGAEQELPMQGPVKDFQAAAMTFKETHKNCTHEKP